MMIIVHSWVILILFIYLWVCIWIPNISMDGTWDWSKHHPMWLYILQLYHHSIRRPSPEWNKLGVLCTLHTLIINIHFRFINILHILQEPMEIRKEEREKSRNTCAYIEIDSPLKWLLFLLMVRTRVASTVLGLTDKLRAIIRRQTKKSINQFWVSIFFLNCGGHTL